MVCYVTNDNEFSVCFQISIFCLLLVQRFCILTLHPSATNYLHILLGVLCNSSTANNGSFISSFSKSSHLALTFPSLPHRQRPPKQCRRSVLAASLPCPQSARDSLPRFACSSSVCWWCFRRCALLSKGTLAHSRCTETLPS